MSKKKAGAKAPAPVHVEHDNIKAPSVVPDGIAILGSHPKTVGKAPFDENWLIYSCSPHNFEHRTLPRFDQWFEVHSPIADKTRAYPYLRFLESVENLWMRDKEASHLFPGATQYPD